MDKFDPTLEDFDLYEDRLQTHFEMLGIDEDRPRVLQLLSLVGSEIYGNLVNWCAPDHPRDKEYAEIVTIIKERYSRKKLVIMHRHSLLMETQKNGQSLEEFYRELEKIAGKCAFNKVQNVKDCVLQMQFIRGLKSDRVREKLLGEEESLCGIKMLQMAQRVETAERTASKLGFKERDNIFNVSDKAGFEKKIRDKKKMKCYRCQKIGHLAKECYSNLQNPKFHRTRSRSRGRREHANRKTFAIKTDDDSRETATSLSVEIANCNKIKAVEPPMKFFATVNGKRIIFELDTGASISIIDKNTWIAIGKPTLSEVNYEANAYGGAKIGFDGTCEVDIQVGETKSTIELHVFSGIGQALFGRDAYRRLKIPLSELEQLCAEVNNCRIEKEPVENRCANVLDKHKEVFKDGLGTCTKMKVSLRMDESKYVGRRFFKARPVPFALKEKIEANLNDMESAGIVKKVSHSKWAAPIVIAPKPNNKIRICGDYKIAVNKCLAIDQYPLPKIHEIFHHLAGGEKYSKMDLDRAYNQLELDEDSKEYTTINTHKGLYRYERMPFGIANAPAIFQSFMEQVLNGIEHVVVYLDDIIITGSNDEEHLSTLEAVLKRLAEYGLHVKKEKCEFLKNEIEVLGHVLTSQGIQTNPKKVEAIENMPTPKNVKEVESFIGMTNYYARFVPHLSELCRPLNLLRRKDADFIWDREHEEAFGKIKEAMKSSRLLTHFNNTLPVFLATDASNYGLGAVVYHKLSDGSEKVIEYASRTMTTTEVKYSQIEKEALAIVWGMERFQAYLYGRKFTLRTDHRPLLKILGPKADTPIIAAKRIHRWAIRLAMFDFHIEYVPTAEFGNADGLSRLPNPDEEITKLLRDEEIQIFQLEREYFEQLPFNKKILQKATSTDTLIRKVMQNVNGRWPVKISKNNWKELHRFWLVRDELHIREGILMRGHRVVIPRELCKQILEMLHMGHIGTTKMKSLAREKIWYPGMDIDIEQITKTCRKCQEHRNNPQKNVLHPWKTPDKVWQRLHIDFLGPFKGSTWFIVVDARSKWVCVVRMNRTTTKDVITELSKIFTTFGLPEQIVSDNGRQFTSYEYNEFCEGLGITTLYSPPYHPASNGEAERNVQTFKKALNKEIEEGGASDVVVRKFLATYRNSPHATTGRTPAEMMFGRPIRTKFDIVWRDDTVSNSKDMHKASADRYVEGKRNLMKENYDKNKREISFKEGDAVFVKSFRHHEPDWIEGRILKKLGKTMYRVKVANGKLQRHANQLRKREQQVQLQVNQKVRRSTRDRKPVVRFDPSIYNTEFSLRH